MDSPVVFFMDRTMYDSLLRLQPGFSILALHCKPLKTPAKFRNTENLFSSSRSMWNACGKYRRSDWYNFRRILSSCC